MTLESQIKSMQRNLQSQIDSITQTVNSLQTTINPQFPIISKFQFRKLLTQNQELIWDNYDILKDILGLTAEQFMALRTFRAMFDTAEKLDMTEDYMVNGMHAIAGWGLQYDGQHVFELTDVERILRGEEPVIIQEEIVEEEDDI